jgi:surface polysaccharide O-acyltransferase-like enzyme
MSDRADTDMSRVGAKGSRNILRSIVAIVAGFLVIVVLSVGTDVVMHATGIYPPWFQYMPDSLFLLATAYRVVYSVLGCYITARLAPDNPMRHALILGAIGVVLSIVGAIGTWNQGPEFGPKWYPLTLIVMSLPLAWLGGKIRLMQMNGK